MFTVKIVYPDYENLLEAETVVAHKLDDDREKKVQIFFHNGEYAEYSNGRIYVMNGNGKTVSVYNLNIPSPMSEVEAGEAK